MARPKPLPEARLAAAEASGYKRGAHAENDKKTGIVRYDEKVVVEQNATLDIYVTWSYGELRDLPEATRPCPLDVKSVGAYALRDGAPAPALHKLKDFIRFYVKQSKGRITEHATIKTTVSQAVFFFAGFARATRTVIKKEDRKEIFKWIRRVLPLEGECVNASLPKYNFGPEVLDRLLLALWTRPDLFYIHERTRVQFAFALHLYCWTGARISAFFKKKNGLQYKDISLVLRRRADGVGYEMIWKIDQRWVKNNRDPQNVVFGTAGKESPRLLYNDSVLLLALAFADNALYGFETLDDFWKQEIPPGENELILRWKEEAENRPILRNVTKSRGVCVKEWQKHSFKSIYRSLLDIEGYTCDASIHMIRRYLGKKIDKQYTEVERSQHLTQSDPRIFGTSYVARTSAVDGQSAFLGEDPDQSVSEYFQGLSIFREEGVPTSLPQAMKASLQQDPAVLALDEREAAAATPGEAFAARKARTSLLKSLEYQARQAYRKDWVKKRRDWKILTRGKVASDIDTDVSRLCLLIPERARIAALMKRDLKLSRDEMRQATRDLLGLCQRDCPYFSFPGEEGPAKGLCPVCSKTIQRMSRRDQSSHIHGCYGTQRARKLGLPPSHLEYCYDCTDWYVRGRELDEHYSTHLSTLPKNCGVVTYHHTLIKPAYCLFHLAATDLPSSQRMRPWSRDADCLAHIKDEHLREVSWPLPCPLGCREEHKDELFFFYHLSDCHGYNISNITQKRSRQERHVVRAQKQEDGSEDDTDDELSPVEELEIEQGADPTLPIILDDDDPVWPPPDVRLAASQPFRDFCPSPKEDEAVFCRAVSLCSTTDDEPEGLGESGIESDPLDESCVSDWVHLRPSPAPVANFKRPDLGSVDLAGLVDWVDLCRSPSPDSSDLGSADLVDLAPSRAKLPPSPEPPAMDKCPPCPSLCSTPGTIEDSNIDKTEAGADFTPGGRVESQKARVKLNYKRPKIVLRLPLTPTCGEEAGGERERPRKRRRKA